jgi:hypothetical protein
VLSRASEGAQATGPAAGQTAARQAGEAGNGRGLRLERVSVEYAAAGDQVVALRVSVDNRGAGATASTSIHWEPAFAQRFAFLDSEPAPWRVRTDERGWGVLDTAGVLPAQIATFQVRFLASTPDALEPAVIVVADGATVVGEAIARAASRHWPRPAPAQRTFDRGALAAAADALPLVPADSRGAFPLAVAMSVLLSLLVGAGVSVILGVAGASAGPPRGRWPAARASSRPGPVPIPRQPLPDVVRGPGPAARWR